MPWRDSAASILALFLGGEEAGAAWGAVLFGDYNPTGKLPIQFPSTEAETIAPNPNDTVPYVEGLATSMEAASALLRDMLSSTEQLELLQQPGATATPLFARQAFGTAVAEQSAGSATESGSDSEDVPPVATSELALEA